MRAWDFIENKKIDIIEEEVNIDQEVAYICPNCQEKYKEKVDVRTKKQCRRCRENDRRVLYYLSGKWKHKFYMQEFLNHFLIIIFSVFVSMISFELETFDLQFGYMTVCYIVFLFGSFMLLRQYLQMRLLKNPNYQRYCLTAFLLLKQEDVFSLCTQINLSLAGVIKPYFSNSYSNEDIVYMLKTDNSRSYNSLQNRKGLRCLKKRIQNDVYYNEIVSDYETKSMINFKSEGRILNTALEFPNKAENETLVKNFNREKLLMNLCDRIIAIAHHSYDDIINLYQIPKEKTILIPHGLADTYRPLSEEERMERRKKYGISTDDRLLIFAGRISQVKGIEYLAETFSIMEKQDPKLRLIIAGDGSFEQIFPLLKPAWSKVIFTGFVDKPTLYELFSISDIGILPSLHEEFGFVALEMMMMKLPLIVGNTTGLAELVKDGESGVLVSTQNKELIMDSLQEAIHNLLINETIRMQFAQEGREHFIQKYELTIFQQRMQQFYQECLFNQTNIR